MPCPPMTWPRFCGSVSPACGRARIERDRMRDYFRGPGAPGADPDDPGLRDSDAVTALLAGAESRRGGPVQPDNWADIHRLIDGG